MSRTDLYIKWLLEVKALKPLEIEDAKEAAGDLIEHHLSVIVYDCLKPSVRNAAKQHFSGEAIEPHHRQILTECGFLVDDQLPEDLKLWFRFLEIPEKGK